MIDTRVAFLDTVPHTPLFARQSAQSAVWASLMEKIWAKLNMNYDNIVAGNPAEGIHLLLGIPVYSYPLDVPGSEIPDYEEAWFRIEDALSKNYLVIMSTEFGNQESLNELGLPYSHSFSVLDAVTLEDNGFPMYQVYKMRNPWGVDITYTGNFNDADPIWNMGSPTFASQAGFESNIGDGIIWVQKEDLFLTFDNLEIAHYRAEF